MRDDASGNEPRTHDARFDLIRAAACFGVVLLHTTGQFQFAPERSPEGFLAVLVHCAARASVPIFFMTAGYFAFPKIQSAAAVGAFLRKRFRRLWIPTALWSGIYLALYLAGRVLSERPVDASLLLRDWLWKGKPGAGYHLWFLYTLGAAELVAPWIILARKRRPRATNAALVALWLAFGAYAVVSIARGGDGRSELFFGVLALGYLPWYSWGAFARLSARPATKRGVRLSLFVACVGLGAMISTTYDVGYRYARSDFLPPCLLLTLGLWNLALARRADESSRVARTLERIGKLSFGVYASHVAVLALLSPAFPNAETSALGAIVLAVATFVVSALVAAVLRRIPYLRQLA